MAERKTITVMGQGGGCFKVDPSDPYVKERLKTGELRRVKARATKVVRTGARTGDVEYSVLVGSEADRRAMRGEDQEPDDDEDE